MKTTNSDTSIAKLTDTLSEFARSERSYPVPENWGVALSEGVRYLMNECPAAWLVEGIVLQYGNESMRVAMLDDRRLRTLHHWQAELIGDVEMQAEVVGRAAPRSDIFYRFYTEFDNGFPFDVFSLYAEWNGERWVLRLPSEMAGRAC